MQTFDVPSSKIIPGANHMSRVKSLFIEMSISTPYEFYLTQMHLISLEYHVLHYIKRIQIVNAIPILAGLTRWTWTRGQPGRPDRPLKWNSW